MTVQHTDPATERTSEPIPLQVTRWKCPHCNRTRAHKSATVEHIARCWRNPEARSCFTCDHFEQVDSEPEVGIFVGSERCDVGVALPERDLPVHCPKWEATR